MADGGDRIGRIIDLSAARGGNGMEWRGKLASGEKGTLPTLANALILLGNDPALRGLCAYNDFAHEHVITRPAPTFEDGAALLPGPYPRPWGPEDVALVQGFLQRLWCSRFNKMTAEDAMLAAAALNRFHPVREWLAKLKWDGVERIDRWLHLAFGCPADAYHAAVGSKFLVAAVRRVLLPGCKFDSMLVLEGLQNLGKSRACAALAGSDWFSDSLEHDLGKRDAAIGLNGKWIIELGELDSLIRSEVETVKAFLSRSTDRFRPLYGKSFIDRPRQGVLIGTTNQHDYLRDSTGNRRFWPARCEKAEHAWIAEVREQLWAEAIGREAEGEALWLDESTVRNRANSHQSERLAEDVWANRIRDWITQGSRTEVRADLALVALGVTVEKQTRAAEMRVTSVLRADGWAPHVYRPRPGAKTIRSWFAPGTVLPNTGGKVVTPLQPQEG